MNPKKIICKIYKHDWFWWREDANYRYCKRCRLWQKIRVIHMWLDCEKLEGAK